MLFDVNCYLGAWPFSLVPEMTGDLLARHLARAGVDCAAVSPLAAVFQPEPMPANRALFAALRGKRRFVPLPVVNPALANWREQLDACAAVEGVRAVRLYPNYHNYRLSSRALRPFVEALAQHRLRLVITARLEDERHRYFALRIKGVPVADLAGFLGANPECIPLITGLSVNEAPELAAARENFLADISYQENVELAAMLRGKLSTSRLMFGSLTPLVSVAAQTGKLTAPDFTAAERRRIAYTNAARFFSKPHADR
ncbi:MAG: amidohydrolase family protein [Opitutaceae bacterium]|nr:amidohydrolase family protein [Opitutaceae bacterium]